MITIQNWKKTVRYIKFDINNNSFINIDEIYWLDFNINKYLQLENQKWYNIYYILNDFYNNRSEKNIYKFNQIWIDLDYCDLSLEELLKDIKLKLNILPFKINKTFKWYHVIFNLESSLKLINTTIYKELYKYINTKLWWDKKMKDITSILKVEWYIDHKDNRKYLITNVYINKDNKITSAIAENILKKDLIFDTDREKKIEEKIKNKKIRNTRIENIDWLELISYLNKIPKYSWITIINNWIKWTTWLKLYEEDWKTTIKDFSWKGRYWISWFLLNYILKDLDNLTKMSEYAKILSIFWIKLRENYQPTKFPLMYLLWLKKDDIVDDLNNKIIWKDKWFIMKLLISINYILNNTEEEYIEEKSIIELLKLSKSKNSKDKIRKWLIQLSTLKIKLEKKELIEDKIYNKEFFKNIVDLEIIKDNRWVRKYKVKFLKIKDDNKFYTGLILTSNVEKTWKYKIKIDELKKLTWVDNYNMIRERYLLPYKKEKLIKWYKKEWNYIIYY